MKTKRMHLLALAVAIAASSWTLGETTEARAQYVVYRSETVPVPVTVYYEPFRYEVHYHRVLQGTSWVWSPALGWHLHYHYIDVPHQVPVQYFGP